MQTHALFVPRIFAADLEADGVSERTAKMKENERKKDIGRIEGALEQLGVPFKHEKVGTSATLTADEAKQVLSLLPPALPSRAELDIHRIAE